MGRKVTARGLLQKLEKQDRRTLALKTAFATVSGETELAWLVEVLGVEASMRLILAFGGTRLAVPSAKEVVESLDVAGAALRVTLDGEKAPKAAKDAGVSVSAVRKSVRAMKRLDDELKEARAESARQIRRSREVKTN